jgi:hypothetical protein
MNLEIVNYLMDAYDLVSAWDLPEEDFAQAVKQQALLMAGSDPAESFYIDD